jgi:O-antigen/teichoic acid export membrane protein
MTRSAYSLMVNAVLTSALGLAYWLVAARLFPASEVGDDSALIAAITVLAVVGQLDLGTMLLRFLPAERRLTVRLIAGAYAVSVAASLALSIGFVLVAPRLSPQLTFLWDSPVLAVEFVVISSLWAVFSLQDYVLIALRRAPWVAVENTVYGVLKLATLPVLLLTGTSHAVFVAWVGPVIPLIVVVSLFLRHRAVPAHMQRHRDAEVERPPLTRNALVRFMAFDYGAIIANQAASRILPVLVVAALGSTSNAYFYIAFTIVSAFDLLFQNVTMSLMVEASADERRLGALTRLLVRRFLVFVVAGVVFIVVAAPLILLPFGHAYADNAVPVLRLLVLASGFRALLALFAAAARVRGHTGWLLLTYAGLAALLLPLTALLIGRVGLSGVALAWLIAHAVVAAAVLWPTLHMLRTPWTRAATIGEAP